MKHDENERKKQGTMNTDEKIETKNNEKIMKNKRGKNNET